MERGPDRDPDNSIRAQHIGVAVGAALGLALYNLTLGAGITIGDDG